MAGACKVIMLGDSNVGKSLLVNRFLGRPLSETLPPTISVEFADKTVQLSDGREMCVELWDTGKRRSYTRPAAQASRQRTLPQHRA